LVGVKIKYQLRSQGVLQLGSVSRFYMEASGNFTLISNPEPEPGLSVLPPWDDDMRKFFKEHPEKQICMRCGLPQKSSGKPYACYPNCANEKWITAVEETTKNQ